MSCISHGPDRIQMKEKIIDNFVVNCHICRKKLYMRKLRLLFTNQQLQGSWFVINV
jgi:hypothetical protein